MNDYMTLLHKHKINGGFLAPDRIPMEERNKNEMILELQNEVHTKDKEIERLKQVEKEHQRINGKLREENKKLNNIIKAIEKALKDNIEELKDLTFSYDRIYEDKEILKLIQELKGSDKIEKDK